MRLSSLLFFLIFTLSCSTNSVYKNNIIFDVEYLSSDELEGRSTGSKGEELAANYIEKRFKELNIEPIGEDGYFQEFSFKQKSHPHETIITSDSIQENSVTGKNVIGFINNKSINTVVVGAHYDHLGFGEEGSLYGSDSLKIHNGADDNASGVSLMLDLAAKLKNSNNNNNNYLFIAFSGEELGLLGSNFFVKNPTIDIKSININSWIFNEKI